MEALFYEIRPWAFGGVGVYSILKSADSRMLFFSGALLALAAFMIIYARSRSRHKLSG